MDFIKMPYLNKDILYNEFFMKEDTLIQKLQESTLEEIRILEEMLDKDYLMDELKESTEKSFSNNPDKPKYRRGKGKCFDFEEMLVRRRHQEYFIFLKLSLMKGFKIPLPGQQNDRMSEKNKNQKNP